MKEARAFPLALLLALAGAALVSCASTGDKGPTAGRSIVAVVPADATLLAENVRTGIAAFGKDFVEVKASVMGSSTADGAAQARLVDDLVARATDAIIVIPVDAASLSDSLARAATAHLLTVTIGAPSAQKVSCDVEPWDEAALGRHMVDVMATWMNYAGEWVPVVDAAAPGSAAAASDAQDRRLDGEMAEARAAYPGLSTSVDKLEADSRQAAHDGVMELLKTHPGLKAVLGNSAAAVQGAAQAVIDSGLVGKVGVFGTSLPSEAGDFIARGAVISIQFSAPADAAYAAARAAYEMLKGGRVETGMDLGRAGYDRVSVKPNSFGVRLAYGMAWVDVDKGTVKDWIDPNGKYKL